MIIFEQGAARSGHLAADWYARQRSRAQVVITAGNPASNQSACNGKKSVLGNDVQNMVDFITKDSSNYIYQPPCAAPTCTCMIHVGIISFGPILVVLRARYERSWAAFSGSDQKM